MKTDCIFTSERYISCSV